MGKIIKIYHDRHPNSARNTPFLYTQELLHRFLNDRPEQRGGIEDLITTTVDPTLKALRHRPDNLELVEEMAKQTQEDGANINQIVWAVSEISAIASLVNAHHESSAVVAATKHLALLAQIESIVDAVPQEPDMVAEARNTIFKGVNDQLEPPLLGAPKEIIYEGKSGQWIPQPDDIDDAYEKAARILLNKDRAILAEQLIASQYVKSWALSICKTGYNEIEAEFNKATAEEAAKTTNIFTHPDAFVEKTMLEIERDSKVALLVKRTVINLNIPGPNPSDAKVRSQEESACCTIM